VRYSVLTPNLKGFEASIANAAIKPDEIVVFASATEAFSQRNINCSIEESIERFRPVVAAAHEHGIKVRSAISCALGCPYQGEVSPDEVERVVRLMKAIGVRPLRRGRHHRRRHAQARAGRAGACSEALPDRPGQRPISTTPMARRSATSTPASSSASTTFDASVAGLGGCPYAKGATGNVGTEDVLFMLDGLGIETGIDIDKLVECGRVHFDAARAQAGFAHRVMRCLRSAPRRRKHERTATDTGAGPEWLSACQCGAA